MQIAFSVLTISGSIPDALSQRPLSEIAVSSLSIPTMV
uniref:Uncharacterized protein n=1 Tax=Salmonella phage vB_STmST313_KE31 TaxID=3161181 RepID=A0AAU8GIC2_9CAUD